MTTQTDDQVREQSPVAAPSDDAYLERLRANMTIAEQSLHDAVRGDRSTHATPAVPAARPSSLENRSQRTSLAVTVVIPVFNECETIVEIVRRVQAVGVHSEIIIVDDFSTDGTRDILLQLEREPDIRVLMHGYNRGKGAALRTAFQHCRGDLRSTRGRLMHPTQMRELCRQK